MLSGGAWPGLNPVPNRKAAMVENASAIKPFPCRSGYRYGTLVANLRAASPKFTP
jgi:hypothetical protein